MKLQDLHQVASPRIYVTHADNGEHFKSPLDHEAVALKSIHGTFNFSTFQTKENDKN